MSNNTPPSDESQSAAGSDAVGHETTADTAHVAESASTTETHETQVIPTADQQTQAYPQLY